MRSLLRAVVAVGVGTASLFAAVGNAAADPVQNRNQLIVTFDDLAEGTEDFSFLAFNDFRNQIFGGTVNVPILGWARSAPNVYVGTRMGFRLADPFNYSWPAVGAYFTGTENITVTLFSYDRDGATEVAVHSSTIPTYAANHWFSFGEGPMHYTFTSAVFESAAPFQIDNLTLGLPDVGYGIPEPATWVSLLGGFALAGGALRRRKAMTRAIA